MRQLKNKKFNQSETTSFDSPRTPKAFFSFSPTLPIFATSWWPLPFPPRPSSSYGRVLLSQPRLRFISPTVGIFFFFLPGALPWTIWQASHDQGRGPNTLIWYFSGFLPTKSPRAKLWAKKPMMKRKQERQNLMKNRKTQKHGGKTYISSSHRGRASRGRECSDEIVQAAVAWPGEHTHFEQTSSTDTPSPSCSPWASQCPPTRVASTRNHLVEDDIFLELSSTNADRLLASNNLLQCVQANTQNVMLLFRNQTGRCGDVLEIRCVDTISAGRWCPPPGTGGRLQCAARSSSPRNRPKRARRNRRCALAIASFLQGPVGTNRAWGGATVWSNFDNLRARPWLKAYVGVLASAIDQEHKLHQPSNWLVLSVEPKVFCFSQPISLV